MRAIRGSLPALAVAAVALMFAGCSGPPAGESSRAAGGSSAGSQGATSAAAAGAPCAPSAGVAGLRVTVLLDSGRADPTFAVEDGDAIGELAQLFAAARPDPAAASGQARSPSAPGYKGIRIENPGGEGGLPRQITVYRDRVQAGDGGGGGERFFTGGGGFESFLIGQAVRCKALDPKDVERIRPARGGPAR